MIKLVALLVLLGCAPLLRAAIEPLHSRITTWLDSFGKGAMTDEAAAFMYMQLARRDAGRHPPLNLACRVGLSL